MKFGQNNTYWGNCFGQVLWRWNENCGFVINDHFMEVSTFFLQTVFKFHLSLSIFESVILSTIPWFYYFLRPKTLLDIIHLKGKVFLWVFFLYNIIVFLWRRGVRNNPRNVYILVILDHRPWNPMSQITQLDIILGHLCWNNHIHIPNYIHISLIKMGMAFLLSLHMTQFILNQTLSEISLVALGLFLQWLPHKNFLI